MKTNRQFWKHLIMILCILLIFAYASIALLSHSQECPDSDCAICAMIETSRNILILLALPAVIHPICKCIIYIVHSYRLSYRNDTLVGLKVKLSD